MKSSGPHWFLERRHNTASWSGEFRSGYGFAVALQENWALFWTATAWHATMYWSHKFAGYCRGLHLLLKLSVFRDMIWLSHNFLCQVKLLTRKFSRPSAFRMVVDVARIQCDVKWLDRPAFSLMRPSKLSKVFISRRTLQYHTASLSLNLPVLRQQRALVLSPSS